jgi:hypothetical protein
VRMEAWRQTVAFSRPRSLAHDHATPFTPGKQNAHQLTLALTTTGRLMEAPRRGGRRPLGGRRPGAPSARGGMGRLRRLRGQSFSEAQRPPGSGLRSHRLRRLRGQSFSEAQRPPGSGLRSHRLGRLRRLRGQSLSEAQRPPGSGLRSHRLGQVMMDAARERDGQCLRAAVEQHRRARSVEMRGQGVGHGPGPRLIQRQRIDWRHQ